MSRWISVDPPLATGAYIGNDPSKLPGIGGVFNPINLNGYHYAGNNPVKYVDADGRWMHIVRRIMTSPAVYRAGRFISRTPAGRFCGRQSDKLYNALARGGNWAVANAPRALRAVRNAGAKQTLKGARNPIVRKAIEKGKQMHAKFSNVWTKKGYTTDKAIPGTRLRPDAISVKEGIIRELKPNNARAIKKGLEQLDRYREAAEKTYEKKFNTILDTYK